jgi:DNA-binding protein HU-beta
MSKDMIIERMIEEAGISKSQAKKAYDSVFNSITSSLQKGDKITLTGFGTFAVGHRKAREGRNPQTGDTIQIPESNVPRFKAGKKLKDAVN